MINVPQLNHLDKLENVYKVQMLKKKISLDTSLHIGYFILQMANLCMLSFYYDCIIKFIDNFFLSTSRWIQIQRTLQ